MSEPGEDESDDSQPLPGSAVSFADLNLRPELQRQLDALGYEEPTPIQREAIPQLLAGLKTSEAHRTEFATGKTAPWRLAGCGNTQRSAVSIGVRGGFCSVRPAD